VAELQLESPGRATISKMLIFPQKMLCRQGLAKLFGQHFVAEKSRPAAEPAHPGGLRP
jgi:hypothetical protein